MKKQLALAAEERKVRRVQEKEERARREKEIQERKDREKKDRDRKERDRKEQERRDREERDRRDREDREKRDRERREREDRDRLERERKEKEKKKTELKPEKKISNNVMNPFAKMGGGGKGLAPLSKPAASQPSGLNPIGGSSSSGQAWSQNLGRQGSDPKIKPDTNRQSSIIPDDYGFGDDNQDLDIDEDIEDQYSGFDDDDDDDEFKF